MDSGYRSDVTEEGDPLFDEPKLSRHEMEGDDTTEGLNFMAVRPWTNVVGPPTGYKRDPKGMTAPGEELELCYAFGYRARDCRNNAHWVRHPDIIVFPVAAVCVVYIISANDQEFFRGHDNDVMCLDYHRELQLCASGSIGRLNTPRLCIWRIIEKESAEAGRMQLHYTTEPMHTISGFHRRGVKGVAISPCGKHVASYGDDDSHSVAVYAVESGLLMYTMVADKSPLIHITYNTVSYVDSSKQFITVGDHHVAFWSEEGTGEATGLKSSCPTHPELAVSTLTSVVCTTDVVVVGTFTGDFFLFYDPNGKFVDRAAKPIFIDIKGRESPRFAPGFLSFVADPNEENTFISGSKNGNVERWRVVCTGRCDATMKAVRGQALKVPRKAVTHTIEKIWTVEANAWHTATDNDTDVLVNSVRSISIYGSTLLVGTILSHIFRYEINTDSKDVVISGHWGNMWAAGGYGEIWALDTHPHRDEMCTCSEDGTVRVWDTDRNKMRRMIYTQYRIRSCAYSPDGRYICIGYYNGACSMLDAENLEYVYKKFRRRRRRIEAVSFSPDAAFLVVCPAETSADVYRLPDPTGDMPDYVGTLYGHSSTITAIDWNLRGDIVQTTSRAYEMLYFSIPDCKHITSSRALADEEWDTFSCSLGWQVQGIWPMYADGTDINAVNRSNTRQLLATGSDDGTVRLFRYPCIGGGVDYHGKMSIPKVKPEYVVAHGHASHVTNVEWNYEDKWLLSAGGHDLAILKWRVLYQNNERPDVPHLTPPKNPRLFKRTPHACHASPAPKSTRRVLSATASRLSYRETVQEIRDRLSAMPKEARAFHVYQLDSFSCYKSKTKTMPKVRKPKILESEHAYVFGDEDPKPTSKKKKKHFGVDYSDY
eukprot:PhM_4_TR6798/c0_g2_i1/m.103346/K18598/EML6; echinoderm microtubule-associated protein-like 6